MFFLFLTLKAPYTVRHERRDNLDSRMDMKNGLINKNLNSDENKNRPYDLLKHENLFCELNELLMQKPGRNGYFSDVNTKNFIRNCKKNEIRFNNNGEIECVKLSLEDELIANCEIYSTIKNTRNHYEKQFYFCEKCSKNTIKCVSSENKSKLKIQCKKINSTTKLIKGCDVYLSNFDNLTCHKYLEQEKQILNEMKPNDYLTEPTNNIHLYMKNTEISCNESEVKFQNELNNNIIECTTLDSSVNAINDCDIYSSITAKPKCAVCKSRKFLDSNSGFQCSESCSIEGDVKVLGINQTTGGYCITAPSVPIDRCDIYSDVSENSINCNTCRNNALVNTKVCVPISCSNGNENCKICQNEEKCAICQKNYFLDLGACSSGCPGKTKVIKTTIVGNEGEEIGFCEDFPLNPIENCEIYNEISTFDQKPTCRKCVNGKVKQISIDGTMQCPELEDLNFEIRDCEIYSDVSNVSTKCKICKNNKYLSFDSKKCNDICSSGEIKVQQPDSLIGGRCEVAQNVINGCKVYSENSLNLPKCKVCGENLFLNVDLQCYADCFPGPNDEVMVKFQLNNSIIGGTCEPGPADPIPSCEVYSDLTPNKLECKTCSSFSFMDNKKCQSDCITEGTVKVIPIKEVIGGRCEKAPLFPLIDRCEVHSDIISEDTIHCNRCNDADIMNTTICPPPSCQNWNNGCDTCRDNDHCLLCLEGFFLDSGVCSQVCPSKVKAILARRTEITGEEKLIRTCERKPDNLIDGCDIYENVSPENSKCRFCKSNFVKYENSSLNNSVECIELENQTDLIDECDIYSDISKMPKCKICNNNHYLNKDYHCVTTCPDSFVNVEPPFELNSGSYCEKEPKNLINNCLVYISVINSNNEESPTLCKYCNNDYFLEGNECVTSCTKEFTKIQPISSTIGGTCENISFTSSSIEHCSIYYLASEGEAIYRCKTCQVNKFLNSAENICTDDCEISDMVKYQPENSNLGKCMKVTGNLINYCDIYSSIDPLTSECKVCFDGITKNANDCPASCRENSRGCAKCDSNTNLCVRCQQNYFLNHQIGICSSDCPENQVKVLLDAEEGEDINEIGGTCEDEPSLKINYCEIYLSTSPYSLYCRVCYDGITQNVDNCEPSCSNDKRSCKYCDINDKCTKCEDNYFLDLDFGVCKKKCPKGTVKLDDVLNGGSCEKNIPNPPISYCDTYSSVDPNHKIVCKECFDGTKNVHKCPNYCKNGSRGCKTCNIQSNTCTKCLPNFFMEAETGICTDFCPKGMVKVLNDEEIDGKCEKKPLYLIENCDVYLNITIEPYPICRTCETNFMLIENNRCDFAVKSCEFGGRNNCVECSKKNISLCGMCRNKKYLLNGECVDNCSADSTTVPSMQGNSSTGFGFICLNISTTIENCFVYESVSPLRCQRCLNEMYIQNNTCVPECEEEYKIDEVNKICTYTCTVEFCNHCPTKKDLCELCDNSYFINKNECVKKCPIGTFTNETRCDECFEGCINCGEGGKCNECGKTYYFFEKMCYFDCPDGTQKNINGDKNCFLFFPDVQTELSNVSDTSRSFLIDGDSIYGNSRISIEANKLIITKQPNVEIFFSKAASNTDSLFFGSDLKSASYLIKTPDNISRRNVIGFKTSEQTKIEVDTLKVNINILSDQKDSVVIGSTYTSVAVNSLSLSNSDFRLKVSGQISYMNFKEITMYQKNKLLIEEIKEPNNIHITADIVFVQRGANVYFSGLKIQQNLELLDYSQISLSNSSRIEDSAKININTNNYLENKKPAILIESNSAHIQFSMINIMFSGKVSQSAILNKNQSFHIIDHRNKEKKANENENNEDIKIMDVDVPPWNFVYSDDPFDCENMGKEGPIGGGSLYNYARCDGKYITAFTKKEGEQTLSITKKRTMSSGAVVGIVICIIVAVGCLAVFAAYFGFIRPITKKNKNDSSISNEKKIMDKL